MFLIYGLVYAGFVVINSMWPKLMAASLGSLNLAIIYGMGLIVLALIMAFIYNAACSRMEERYEQEALERQIEDSFADEEHPLEANGGR
jgi:uncharacterized membrane protein (DUF485 family)